jgi:hypothetical protein
MAQLKAALGLVKGDVGLGNVDNTSDVNKPVSTAQAAADATKAPLVHTHAAGDVTSGQFAIARLASGAPDGTKFIRDDGVLAVPAGGGGGGSSLLYGQTSIAGGDTIANSAAATIFAGKLAAMAGGTVNAVGRVLRIRARGTARNNNAGVAVTWEILVGAVVVASNSVDTGNYGANNVVRGWQLAADLICTTNGASAVFEADGEVEMQLAGNTSNVWRLTNTGNVVDLTTAKDVAIRFTWGAANANNTITKRAMTVELL